MRTKSRASRTPFRTPIVPARHECRGRRCQHRPPRIHPPGARRCSHSAPPQRSQRTPPAASQAHSANRARASAHAPSTASDVHVLARHASVADGGATCRPVARDGDVRGPMPLSPGRALSLCALRTRPSESRRSRRSRRRWQPEGAPVLHRAGWRTTGQICAVCHSPPKTTPGMEHAARARRARAASRARYVVWQGCACAQRGRVLSASALRPRDGARVSREGECSRRPPCARGTGRCFFSLVVTERMLAPASAHAAPRTRLDVQGRQNHL